MLYNDMPFDVTIGQKSTCRNGQDTKVGLNYPKVWIRFLGSNIDINNFAFKVIITLDLKNRVKWPPMTNRTKVWKYL